MSEAKITPKHKLEVLLEWHDTCPGSQAFPPPEPFTDPEKPMSRAEELKQDEELEKAQAIPKHRPTYKKRKPHYDEWAKRTVEPFACWNGGANDHKTVINQQ